MTRLVHRLRLAQNEARKKIDTAYLDDLKRYYRGEVAAYEEAIALVLIDEALSLSTRVPLERFVSLPHPDVAIAAEWIFQDMTCSQAYEDELAKSFTAVKLHYLIAGEVQTHGFYVEQWAPAMDPPTGSAFTRQAIEVRQDEQRKRLNERLKLAGDTKRGIPDTDT